MKKGLSALRMAFLFLKTTYNWMKVFKKLIKQVGKQVEHKKGEFPLSAAGNFLDIKPYLREIKLKREAVPSFDQYPFCVPAIKHLDRLSFHPDVTFIVGENGSGKSTLLEAIAQLLRYNPEGGNKNINFSTRQTHSDLYQYLQIVKGIKTASDGFFLRAESFYNVATYIDEVQYAHSYGGKSLHEQSHGESFLSLLTHRFKGNGLYLLDEPEAALSPSRQLSALVLIHQLVKKDSQFIIATHSPIIMAYPRARIYRLSDDEIREVVYTETEHYQVTKDFLSQREKMMEILMGEE
ncbi:MAG: AAA family ATPase [Anaerolineae bacterium]|nr:AAA family ATPase [Anaerolineae bacterium]